MAAADGLLATGGGTLSRTRLTFGCVVFLFLASVASVVLGFFFDGASLGNGGAFRLRTRDVLLGAGESAVFKHRPGAGGTPRAAAIIAPGAAASILAAPRLEPKTRYWSARRPGHGYRLYDEGTRSRCLTAGGGAVPDVRRTRFKSRCSATAAGQQLSRRVVSRIHLAGNPPVVDLKAGSQFPSGAPPHLLKQGIGTGPFPPQRQHNAQIVANPKHMRVATPGGAHQLAEALDPCTCFANMNGLRILPPAAATNFPPALHDATLHFWKIRGLFPLTVVGVKVGLRGDHGARVSEGV